MIFSQLLICSLVFTDSEEKLVFVFFAQIGHEKSILNILQKQFLPGFQIKLLLS